MSGFVIGSIYPGDEGVGSVIGKLPQDKESTEIETERAAASVLVVDDERLIADTCTQILEDAGFRVKSAYDGWEALQILAEFRPDYLLTDILMPRMNGVELAIAVSKLSPATRILLFSGQVGISDILVDGHERGYHFEFVPKPVHPRKLIERFQKDKR